MTSGSRRTRSIGPVGQCPPVVENVETLADRHNDAHVVLDQQHAAAELSPGAAE